MNAKKIQLKIKTKTQYAGTYPINYWFIFILWIIYGLRILMVATLFFRELFCKKNFNLNIFAVYLFNIFTN